MAKKKYTIAVEKDSGGWFVSDVLELPGCHTQAKTVDELMERTKEAIQAYVESEEDPISLDFVGLKNIEV